MDKEHKQILLNVAHGAVRDAVNGQSPTVPSSDEAELVATGQWYDAELDGDFGEDWPDYRWLAQFHEWEDSRLSQLDVCVMWTRRSQDHDVTLSTLIYTGMPNE